MSYRINKEECVVCWQCQDKCPTKAIQNIEIKVTPNYSLPAMVIDDDLCIECGDCKDNCPVGAITELSYL